MNRKGFVPIFLILAVIAVLAIAGGAWYYQSHHASPVGNPSPQVAINTSTTASNLAAPTSTPCNPNTSDFAVPPLPPVGSDWIQSTSSVGELVNPDAFSIWPRPSSTSGTLSGEEWSADGNGLGGWDINYYYPILTQQGWSREAVVDGYDIWGLIASGYHDEIDGYVKVANGYLRAVTVNDYTSRSTEPNKLIVFASDIVPLSQITPNYQPICPVASSSPQFHNSPYILLQTNLPGTFATDPSGNRVGRDEVASATYNEISSASYSTAHQTTHVLIPDSMAGKYTITLTAKSLWYSGYALQAWIGGNQNPVPNVQDLTGNINNEQTVTYSLNYDPNNVVSSTLVLAATSTPSTTSAPVATTTLFTSSSSAQVGAFTVVDNCVTISQDGIAAVKRIDILEGSSTVQSIDTNLTPGSSVCPRPQSQDINFDGHPDFMVDSDYGSGGTSVAYWLFNTGTRQFYCPGGNYRNCSLMNPSFDTASKTITTWDALGASDSVWQVYQVSGDNLILYQETDVTSSLTSTTKIVKQLENGQMVVIGASTTPSGN
ncbi:MAG: hypothetical protein ABSE18_04610 [Minisyncoccia bacterium]